MKNFDEELGAPIGADGQELTLEQAKAEIENTTRIIEFKNEEGTTYKGKLDLSRLRKFHDRIYMIAQIDATKQAGFSQAEAENLGDLPEDDPRFETLVDLQNSSPKIARAEATIAHAVFVGWNVPAKAPSVDDLMKKGGVYNAYTEAVMDKYGPTVRRSEAGAEKA